MNLANKLTVFRILLVPIFVLVGYLGEEIGIGLISGEFFGISITLLIMDFIFIIASITDKLDGYIARSKNQVTTFGKFLDPLADKILVLTALVILVELGKIPAWIPIIVLAREFIVSGYRLIAVEKGGKVIAASFWGKLKTVTQMVAIIAVFIDRFCFLDFTKCYSFSMTTPEFVFNIATSAVLIISVIATIFSGLDYLKDGKELFKD